MSPARALELLEDLGAGVLRIGEELLDDVDELLWRPLVNTLEELNARTGGAVAIALAALSAALLTWVALGWLR